MAEETLSARLAEVESMLDRSRRRFEEGSRLVEEAHKTLADIQQALIGSPRSLSPEDSEEAASRLLASIKAAGGEMPETLCGGRLAVDQVQRLIRIDGHPIGITEMEYRVLELLAFARNNVVTRAMLLKHLYRRADDQPQPKIIDVFISKLRKKLRMRVGRGRVHRDDPAARLDPARHRSHHVGRLDRIHLLLALRGINPERCCTSHPNSRSTARRSLMPRRSRGWPAFATPCAWSTRSAADRRPTRRDDEEIAAAWESSERIASAAASTRAAGEWSQRRRGGPRGACSPSSAEGREPQRGGQPPDRRGNSRRPRGRVAADVGRSLAAAFGRLPIAL